LLALAVTRAFVRALEDVLARNRGEAIESPKPVEPAPNSAPPSGCGLRAAYEGWLKTQARKKSTRMEFARGIDRFIELHGDLDVVQINRRFGDYRAREMAAKSLSASELSVARFGRLDGLQLEQTA
jgi:hypothetical protein